VSRAVVTWLGHATVLLELAEPTVWFATGPPTPEAQRLAQLMLERRPGALLVYDTR